MNAIGRAICRSRHWTHRLRGGSRGLRLGRVGDGDVGCHFNGLSTGNGCSDGKCRSDWSRVR